MKLTGHLKNAKLTKELGVIFIWANIYGDAKKRFFDGDYICTSSIKSVNFETGVVNTRYSKYIVDNWSL